MRLNKIQRWASLGNAISKQLAIAGMTFLALVSFGGIIQPSVSYAQEDIFGEESDDGGDASLDAPKTDGPKVTHPLAISLLSAESKSPQEAFTMLETLINLKEAPAAWFHLKRLGDQPLEGENALKFVEEIGTGRILAMTGHKDFPEEKRAWFSTTGKNAAEFLRSEETVTATIDGLFSDSIETKKVANRRLQATGAVCVLPFVNKLNELVQAEDIAALKSVRSSIYSLAPQWDSAVQQIGTNSSELRLPAIFFELSRPSSNRNDGFLMAYSNVMSQLPDGEFKGFYQAWSNRYENNFGYRPDSDSARKWAEGQRSRAKRNFESLYSGKTFSSPSSVTWFFDGKKNKMLQRTGSGIANSAGNWEFWELVCSRLNRDQKDLSQSYTAAVLRAAKVQFGLDSPLSADASSTLRQFAGQSPDALSDLLSSSMKENDHLVTLALMQWLQQFPGKIKFQSAAGPKPSIARLAVKCTDSSDSRISTAAAIAILKSNVQQPFAGSSRLTGAIVRTLKAPEDYQGVVAGSIQSTTGSITTAVRTAGWNVTNCEPNKVFQFIQNNRLHFVVITDALGGQRYISVVDRIRSIPSGKNLPVFLVVRSENYRQATEMFRVDRLDPLTVILPEQQIQEELPPAITEKVSRLANRPIPGLVAKANRLQIMQLVNGWLENSKRRKLLSTSQLANVCEPFLFSQGLGVEAAKTLSFHGSGASQTALVEAASNIQSSSEVRAAAAKGFRYSVQHFGTLLTSKQIRLQYQRQNQSGIESKFSQQIHNSILDTIEARHRKTPFAELSPIPEGE